MHYSDLMDLFSTCFLVTEIGSSAFTSIDNVFLLIPIYFINGGTQEWESGALDFYSSSVTDELCELGQSLMA